MAEISLDLLGAKDRQKLINEAAKAGCSVEALAISMLASYLHLLEVADHALPKNAPGVSLKRMGGR